ncbi:hypothetical protein FRB95_008763 [Tulasnella sp. JGI-2019a]|nr:hypothetical protein FRB95_008763 [Tulasnella sp. JGI-2019a]
MDMMESLNRESHSQDRKVSVKGRDTISFGASQHEVLSNDLVAPIPVKPRSLTGDTHTHISDLAVELLVGIFENALTPRTWTYAALQNLALVSKRWLTIIKSTPTLWATAKYDEESTSIDHVNIALARSRDVPLTIICRPPEPCYTPNLFAFLSAIGSNAGRWKSATFDSSAFGQLFPHLEGEQLALPDPFSFDDIGQFGLKITPSLYRLHLEWVIPSLVPCGSRLNLRYLHLGNIGDDQLSPESLLEILSVCTNLESLSLHGLYNYEDGLIEPHVRRITLPHLHTLDMFDLGSTWTVPIAKSVYAGDSVDSIKILSSSATSAVMLEVLSQEETGFGSIIHSFLGRQDQNIMNVSIQCIFTDQPSVYYDVECSSEDAVPVGPPEARLDIEGSDAAIVLRTLADLTRRLSAPDIDFHIEDSTGIFLSVSDVLGQFTSIELLYLRGTTLEAANHIFLYLSQRQPLGVEGEYEWPCPRLKTLGVCPIIWKERSCLLEFLATRFRSESWYQTTATYLPLEGLYLFECSSEEAAELSKRIEEVVDFPVDVVGKEEGKDAFLYFDSDSL